MATPSPKRRGSPDQPLRGVRVGEAQVGGPGPPPGRGAVHDVVVEQGERVQQLEGRAGVDRAVVGRVAAGGDEAPVAERGPQPLAAGGDEATERLHRRPQVRVQRRPAGLLDVDQPTQPGVDAVGDLEERRGGRGHRDRLRDVRDSPPTEPRAGGPPGGRPCGRGDGSTPSGVLPSLELLELGPITSCSGVRLPWGRSSCPGGTKLRERDATVAGVNSPGGPAAASAANHLRGPQTFTVQRWTTSFLR